MSASAPVKIKVSQATKGLDRDKILRAFPNLTDPQKKIVRATFKAGHVMGFDFDKTTGTLVLELVPKWELVDTRAEFRQGRSFPKAIHTDGTWTMPGLTPGLPSLDQCAVRRFPKMIVGAETIPFKVRTPKTTDEPTDEGETV